MTLGIKRIKRITIKRSFLSNTKQITYRLSVPTEREICSQSIIPWSPIEIAWSEKKHSLESPFVTSNFPSSSLSIFLFYIDVVCFIFMFSFTRAFNFIRYNSGPQIFSLLVILLFQYLSIPLSLSFHLFIYLTLFHSTSPLP